MAETRERVRELVETHPEYTLADIGRELGVSRERIRQLAKAEGLTVRKGWKGAGERRSAAPPRPRVITGGVPVPLSCTIVGTIGEMLAAADLMARGLMVFFPLTRTGACDLITLDRDDRTERIEVRCGHRSGKKIIWGRTDKSRSDRRAVVLTGEPVFYEPPF